MKTEEFEKKDGTTGEKHIPEAGDSFTARFDNVMVLQGGQYENYSLGVKTTDEKDIYIKITAGQKKTLDKHTPLTGKIITFESYTNEYGEHVGARVR